MFSIISLDSSFLLSLSLYINWKSRLLNQSVSHHISHVARLALTIISNNASQWVEFPHCFAQTFKKTCQLWRLEQNPTESMLALRNRTCGTRRVCDSWCVPSYLEMSTLAIFQNFSWTLATGSSSKLKCTLTLPPRNRYQSPWWILKL